MSKKFIFDFAGAHCTGKTTLMRSIKRELESGSFSCKIVESVTRDFIVNQNYDLYDKTDSLSQTMVSYFNSGVVLACDADIVLSTAFGVRPLAYSICSDLVNATVVTMHWDYLRFFASDDFQKCRLVTWFYLPVTFPMVEDGVRLVNEKYRTSVDKSISYIFSSSGIKHDTIFGSELEMFDSAMEVINKVL